MDLWICLTNRLQIKKKHVNLLLLLILDIKWLFGKGKYSTLEFFVISVIIAFLFIRPKKKKNYVALTRPKFENWVGRSIFFFFFFTYRERVEFSNIFLIVSKWGKLWRNAVKTHIYKCFFRPLNTNFSKFFAQNWHFQKQTKQKTNDPVFSHFTVGRERAT